MHEVQNILCEVVDTLSRKSRQASQFVRLTQNFDYVRFSQLKMEQISEQIWSLKGLIPKNLQYAAKQGTAPGPTAYVILFQTPLLGRFPMLYTFESIRFLSRTHIVLSCQYLLDFSRKLLLQLKITDFSACFTRVHTLYLVGSNQMVWLVEGSMSAHFQKWHTSWP